MCIVGIRSKAVTHLYPGILYHTVTEDQTLDQRVRCQTVSSHDARTGQLAHGIQMRTVVRP